MTSHNALHQPEKILEFCRTFSTTLEEQTVLQKVVHAAMQLTDSEAASILLYDEQTNQLYFATAAPQPWEVLKQQPVSLTKSLAGKALVQRQPQILAQVTPSQHPFPQTPETAHLAVRNVIAVPMSRGNTPLGVLEVYNKRGGTFRQEDADTLSILASHAAIALHNARLMETAQMAYRELQHIDRMKSDFIAIASHELRTPLGIILGYATHLQEHVDDSLKGPLDAIVRAAGKLKDLVEELSHLENYQQGTSVLRLETTHLQELLESVVARFQPQAHARDIVLTLEMPSDPIMAQIDREKVAIILRHLIHNALTFTDPGGRIAVRLAQLPDRIQITVSDTGIGIPESDLPHIFERFYQVEKHLVRRHGGLGLGLSIAKNMAVAHGGTLVAESQEGSGTTMTLTLPLAPKISAPGLD